MGDSVIEVLLQEISPWCMHDGSAQPCCMQDRPASTGSQVQLTSSSQPSSPLMPLSASNSLNFLVRASNACRQVDTGNVCAYTCDQHVKSCGRASTVVNLLCMVGVQKADYGSRTGNGSIHCV